MKEKTLRIMTIVLLIMTMTTANFLLLGSRIVSYAADVMNQDKSTSHKNVEFMAYFRDDRNRVVDELETAMNTEDLKLYVRIGVKQEGYFNGSILLENSNFKLQKDILSEGITQIEGNTIHLVQINAGESIEFELGIEILKEDSYDLSLLDMKSDIQLEGIYQDNTQKDIRISGTRHVSMKLVNPYQKENLPIIMEEKVITNQVMMYEGLERRVIQIEIQNGLDGNLFPIKSSKLEMIAPTINDAYPEEVKISTPKRLTSTGKEIIADNWNYDTETGKIEIKTENQVNENQVNWTKSGRDTYIVTYIFAETENVIEQKISLNSEIVLYDKQNTTIHCSNEINMTAEEKNSLVTVEVQSQETEIYKGKLYAGLEKELIEYVTMQVNLEKIQDKIRIQENTKEMKLEQIETKQTAVKLSDVLEVLGQTGLLTILDGQTEEVLATIDQNTEVDERGMVVITYPEHTKEVVIETTTPVKPGRLTFAQVKGIKDSKKAEIQKMTEIGYGAFGVYRADGIDYGVAEENVTIQLLETETAAKLEVSKTELSTMKTNENVEIRAILQTREEKNELYKNPVIRITLPEKIEEINIKSIKLLYEEELEIKKATLIGKTIELQLEGEQTSYKEEAIEGATISIVADLMINKKEGSSKEEVKLSYSNEKGVRYLGGNDFGEDSKEIEITSYAGIVMNHRVPEYNMEMVNNEGQKTAELEIASQEKEATVMGEILNNQGNDISDVKILGTFPTKGAKKENNILAKVGDVQVGGVSTETVKVYYSEVADATNDANKSDNKWTEEIQNPESVKKYLIVMDELALNEEIKISYQMNIPGNLEYNREASEDYQVSYTDDATGVVQKVDVDSLTLKTGKGPVIDATLSAVIAGEQKQEVCQGEIIRYEINAKNTGSETVHDLKLIGPIPEGTVYLEEHVSTNVGGSGDEERPGFKGQGFHETETIKEVEFNIETIEPGESIVKFYYVRVKDVIAVGTTITGQAKIEYNEVQKNSEEMHVKVKEGTVRLALSSVDDKGEIQAGYSYRYMLHVKNMTNKEMKDLKISAQVFGGELKTIRYYSGMPDDAKEDYPIIESVDGILTLESLQAGEEIEISINIKADTFSDEEVKQMTVIGNVNVNGKSYDSNKKMLHCNSAKVTLQHISPTEGEYVKAGDIIEYRISVSNLGGTAIKEAKLTDILANELTLLEIYENNIKLAQKKNNQEIQQDNPIVYETSELYDTTGEYPVVKGTEIMKKLTLEPGETKEYVIKAVVNYIEGRPDAEEISNDTELFANGVSLLKSKVSHVLEATGGSGGGDGGDEEPGKENTQNISGIAWIDKNANGLKDDEEEGIPGMMVRLLDIKTNSLATDVSGNAITGMTNNNGFYNLSKVPQGDYMVIFEYDTKGYMLTTYEKEGENFSDTSKAISKQITIDGDLKTVGATEVISITNKNIANMNIGLQEAKVFDLRLDKYIRKVIIQNSKGNVTYNYENATFAKAEIDAKLVNSTNVIVEYKIKITNEGEIDGYVKKIVDNISSDYKFSSELNKDWYQDGGKLYHTSLANDKISPGETKEISLTVTKKITENNTGLITNTAEIVESYNEQGITDIDSTPGNQIKGEDDRGAADLIITIKTGQIATAITLILAIITILTGCAYVMTKKILTKKEI